jgi:hypothetical protein
MKRIERRVAKENGRVKLHGPDHHSPLEVANDD